MNDISIARPTYKTPTMIIILHPAFLIHEDRDTHAPIFPRLFLFRSDSELYVLRSVSLRSTVFILGSVVLVRYRASYYQHVISGVFSLPCKSVFTAVSKHKKVMLRVLMVLGLISTVAAIFCEEARLKCAYRAGCGKALQGYVMGCSAILHEGPPNQCPTICQHALIALMSSDEGKQLMNCECTDDVCRETKQRVEVCRPHVMKAVHNESVVTCEVAQWICAADSLCSTALEYYHMYCKWMFYGKKCTYRCKNSIAILKKQEKAAKLNTCRCNGKEEYDCPAIRANMAKLCFNKEPEVTQILTEIEDTVDINKPTYGDGEVEEDRHNNQENTIDNDDVNDHIFHHNAAPSSNNAWLLFLLSCHYYLRHFCPYIRIS